MSPSTFVLTASSSTNRPPSAAQSNRERREAKSSNKLGKPIALKSKIAAAALDPHSPANSVFVAESAGSVRRVNVDVGLPQCQWNPSD